MSDSLIDSIDGITWIDDETALNAKNMNNIEKRISINDTNIREVNSDLNSFKSITNTKLIPLEDIDSNRISSWDNKFGPTDSYKTPSEMLDQLQPKADVSQTDPTKRDFIKNKNLLVSDVREKDSNNLSFIKNKEDLIADFDAEEQNSDGTPNLSYIKNKQVMEVGRLVSTISNALDDDPTFIQVTNEEKVVYSAEYPELYSLLPNHKKFFELENSFTKYNAKSAYAFVYNGEIYFVSDTTNSVSKLNRSTNTLSTVTFAIPELIVAGEVAQYDEYKFKCVEDVWFLEVRWTEPAEEGSELADTSCRRIYYSTELPTEESYWTSCTFDSSIVLDSDNSTPVSIDFYSSGVMKQNYYGWYIVNGYNVYFTEDINSGSFTNLKSHLNLSTTIFGSGSKTIKDFVPFDKTTSNTAVGVINVNGTLYMLYNNGVFSAQSLGVSSSNKLSYFPDNTILRYDSKVFKITPETTASSGIIDTGIYSNKPLVRYKHTLDTSYSILSIYDTTARYGDTPLYTNIGSGGSFLVIDNELYIYNGSSLLLKYVANASPLADGAATIKLNTDSPTWTPMLGYEKVYVKAKSKYSS